jgi:hypothetical protein
MTFFLNRLFPGIQSPTASEDIGSVLFLTGCEKPAGKPPVVSGGKALLFLRAVQRLRAENRTGKAKEAPVTLTS